MPATLTGDLTKRMRRGEKRVAEARKSTAKSIAQGAAQRSRVDTGQMKRGWKTAEVDDDTSAAYNAVEHVKYNEYGTRYMSAQPMLHPAAEAQREPFRRKIAKAYER